MSHVSAAIHVTLSSPVEVAHHCDHDDGTTSWRLDGLDAHSGFNSIYFSCTVADLRAFGEAVLAAAGRVETTEVPS